MLVPSCTDTLAGHNRVSLSCRARALELDAAGWVFAELDLPALAQVRAHGQVYNHRDWSTDNHLAGAVRSVRLA